MTPAIAQRVELTGGHQVWTDAQRMLVRLSTGKSFREGVKYSASAFSGVRKSMPENPACRNFAPISSGVKKLTKGSPRSEGKVGGSNFILDLKHPLHTELRLQTVVSGRHIPKPFSRHAYGTVGERVWRFILPICFGVMFLACSPHAS